MELCTNARHISDTPTAVALGTFDGVHRGHAAVIACACNIARADSLLSTVFTFTELPRNAFLPVRGRIPAICDFNERARLIAALGVELLVCPDFTESFRNISPEYFVEEMLIGCLNARHIICGHDHRFGANGRGDASLLIELCNKRGVSVTIIPPVFDAGERISSTRIRGLLLKGDVDIASRLLGRNYSITAPAQRLYRNTPVLMQCIHTVTKNLPLLLPADGAYASVLSAGDASMTAVTQINNAEHELVSYPSAAFTVTGQNVRVEFIRRI